MGYHKLVVPTINVNDEKVTLGSKEVENLSFVKKGEVLCCFETSKSTEDFISEYEGYIIWLYEEFEEIKIGKDFCYIYDTLEEAKNHKEENKAAELPEGFKASKKAIEYAKSIGFDIMQIKKNGIVKTEDIDAFIKKNKEDDFSLKNVDFVYNSDFKRIAVLGAGRGSMQVLDLITHIPGHVAIAIYDDDVAMIGKYVDGVKVLGPIDFNKIAVHYKNKEFDYVVNGIGGSCNLRKKIYDELTVRGVPFCNLIHPTVVIGNYVKLGSGNVILPMTHIGPHVEIGNDCFITAKTSIEHHNIVGSHCTFGPGVMTSGSVTIGDCVKFGAGVFAEPLVKVGSNCKIASGSILTKHIPKDSIVRCKYNLEILREANS